MIEKSGHILLVDDDPGLLRLLSIRLEQSGFNVIAVESAAAALQAVRAKRPDMVISDLRMDGMDGIGLLDELQQTQPGLPVIIITAHGTIPDAVTATQSGALGFLTKPINKDDLLRCVDKAMRLGSPACSERDWRSDIITRSARMEELLAEAYQVAQSDTSVLIRGESGSGKELLAAAIHKASPRRLGPFVAINCGAIPEQLLESELFGHKKGSFTGATDNHEGLFVAADGGTLLLDEIGDMHTSLQVKLLRVLQERRIRPVGSTQDVAVDVRVISATHKDLQEEMKDNRFREDLFYRLNVVQLTVPAIDERREDIPLLVNHILQRLAERAGTKPKVFSPEAMEMLVAAHWPGNVRQLANVVEQNVALCPAPVISARMVEKSLGEKPAGLPPFAQARDEFIRSYLIQLLQSTGGNVSQAARLARRNRTDFYKLLARHEVDPQTFKL
ncbi:MAG: sigma 54-interacting transcriptional regulator [Pseudomonadota bacterium]